MSFLKYSAIYDYKKMKLLYEEYIEKKRDVLETESIAICQQFSNSKLQFEDRKKLVSIKYGSWLGLIGENNIQYVVLTKKDMDETWAYTFLSKLRKGFNKIFPKTYAKASKKEHNKFQLHFKKHMGKYNNVFSCGNTQLGTVTSSVSENYISAIRKEFDKDSTFQKEKIASDLENKNALEFSGLNLQRVDSQFVENVGRNNIDVPLSEEVAGNVPSEEILKGKIEIKDGIQILCDERDIESIDKCGPIILSIMTITIVLLFVLAFVINTGLAIHIKLPRKTN